MTSKKPITTAEVSYQMTSKKPITTTEIVHHMASNSTGKITGCQCKMNEVDMVMVALLGVVIIVLIGIIAFMHRNNRQMVVRGDMI